MNYCMQTYSGALFDFSDIQNASVDISDIAHALSMTCRFNGHVSNFYSVAEHSYIIAKTLLHIGAPPLTALFGLLHDASEAYLNDIVRPAKSLIQGYKEIENTVQDRIESQLITKYIDNMDKGKWKNIHAHVKLYDNYILSAEKRVFYPKPINITPDSNIKFEWAFEIVIPKHIENILYKSIKCLSPIEIEYKFLMLYYKLKTQLLNG